MSNLFDFEPQQQLFAVMGNPVEHSKSPQIHKLFAAQFNIALDYQKILVEPGGFEQAVSNFRASGGRGLNITVPFKLQAWYVCDQLTERARVAEAVNTIWFGEKRIHGDNTDGAGLVRDITRNLAFPIRQARALLLGAGGAARGVLGPLLKAGPDEVVLANRTVDKAVLLEKHFVRFGNVRGCGLDDVSGKFDLVINATAASLQGKVPAVAPEIFSDQSLAYDLMYGDEETAFLVWAAKHGAVHRADGLGMLVEQAAESFSIWHNRKPQTLPVIEALRSRTTGLA